MEETFDKYGLIPGNAILAEEKHQPLFKELAAKPDVPRFGNNDWVMGVCDVFFCGQAIFGVEMYNNSRDFRDFYEEDEENKHIFLYIYIYTYIWTKGLPWFTFTWSRLELLIYACLAEGTV